MPATPGTVAVHVRVNRDGRFIIGDQAVSAELLQNHLFPSRSAMDGKTLILVTSGGNARWGRDHSTRPRRSPTPPDAR